MIERVFSRLYRYLKFKSTTKETFNRHFNVDMGFKYLDSESIFNSDKNRQVYFYEGDEVPYVRYLRKLAAYTDDQLNGEIGLSSDEISTLRNFQKVLEKKIASYIKDRDRAWNLCPLCKENRDDVEGVSGLPWDLRMKMRAAPSVQTYLPDGHVFLVVRFNLGNGMEMIESDVDFDGLVNIEHDDVEFDAEGRPKYVYLHAESSMFPLAMSSLGGMISSSPRYTDGENQVDYELVGFSTTPNGDDILGLDGFLDLANFDGMRGIALYARWKPKSFIVKFSPGEKTSVVQGTMPDIVVASNQMFSLPECGFTLDDSQKISRFTYHDDDEWKSVEDSQDKVDLRRFANWRCMTSQFDLDNRFSPGNRVRIQGNVGSSSPVVVFSAQWEDATWSRVDFEVNGKVYCEVLVSTTDGKLVYPTCPPGMKNDWVFLGWDQPEGRILDGELDNSQSFVVCDNDDIVCLNPLNPPPDYIVCGGATSGDIVCKDTSPIVCDGQDGSVMCHPTNVSTWNFVVNARLGKDTSQYFNVTFKWGTDDDEPEKTQSYLVQENSPLKGHVVPEADVPNGCVFRYWKLKSGNISSSYTVLSDCVFEAVYDKMQTFPDEEIVVSQTPLVICPMMDGRSDPDDLECEYYAAERNVCTFGGMHPRDYNWKTEPGCPYLKMIEGVWNANVDFQPGSLIQIEDVKNLLNALFKINIHIAETEFFFKEWIEDETNWWYGWTVPNSLVCNPDTDDIVCEGEEEATSPIICGSHWISFEPTVELKFSNLHAANQVVDGKLICTSNGSVKTPISPVNRDLMHDGCHYSEDWLCYDYKRGLVQVQDRNGNPLPVLVDVWQEYYAVEPLHLHGNSAIQSPTDMNDFVPTRGPEIQRNNKQVQTFTSVVKKYRPLVMPNVRDIFDECQGAETKYEADVNNDYGVFGWCTIPSKTMVDMQYNEQALYVPSSYDHHNRIGGNNFLQLDSDLANIYKKWIGDKIDGRLEDNAKDTWCYLYGRRDWTYFIQPFFNKRRNNELFSFMLDTYGPKERPSNSDHINGVIFETSNQGRNLDSEFGDVVKTCEFLARHHHGKNALEVLAMKPRSMLSFSQLKELTAIDNDFNAVYGSECPNLDPDTFRFPEHDWVDDYDKTGSYLLKDDGAFKYNHNLGQAHAIDDFDEDSVWFYITMVEPLEGQEEVVEIEDIMPFVFWWRNRGADNNGPTVDCYGLESNAKLNYEKGGWCYSGPQLRNDEQVTIDPTTGNPIRKTVDKVVSEQRWHAVQHTLGADFSRNNLGGTVLQGDNSGNVYKGAFDPNCAGSNEKWKVHQDSPFGTNQHEDPTEDKYWLGENAHGDGAFNGFVPDELNEDILESIKDRPMTWNLWNVVRHYVFIKWFKNKHRPLGNDQSSWSELEARTHKIVKGIYRTYKQT